MKMFEHGTHEESGDPAGHPVLVVGCGFIGRNMVEGLSGRGHSVSALTLSEPVGEVHGAASRVIIGDARDPDVLRDAMSGVRHVAWCAGGLMPREAEADPDRDRDLTLTPLETLASLAPEFDGVSITYISSGGTVYGSHSVEPVSENDPTTPIGAYGRNKLLAEDFLVDSSAKAGFKVRILRCSNVYGPNQPSNRGQGAVAVFTERISSGEPIEIFGDGGAFRDYVHVDDVVRATRKLWDEGGPAVLNCGSGQAVSIIGLIEALEKSLGRTARITRLPGRDFDVSGIVLDIGRITALIDFDPVDLATGLGVDFALAPND